MFIMNLITHTVIMQWQQLMDYITIMQPESY